MTTQTFDTAQAAYILAANLAMARVAAATAVYHSSADNAASQAIMRAADGGGYTVNSFLFTVEGANT